MGQLHIIDGTGHTVIPWDARDVTTVDTAKRIFAQALLEGRLAIGDGKIMHKFDSSVKRVTLIAPQAGG